MRLLIGDVIAFSGAGWTSHIIKAGQLLRGYWKTWRISHVGIIVSPGRPVEARMVHSTSLSKLPDAVTNQPRRGVQAHYVRKYVVYSRAKAWRYPLRVAMPTCAWMCDWLEAMHRAKTDYDYKQAYASWSVMPTRENLSTVFCSELVAQALELGGAIAAINASEVLPAELCAWPIFHPPQRII